MNIVTSWIVSIAAAALLLQDAAAHKAWMNDAADVQDELREQLAAKSSAKAADAATKMEALMAQTQTYWAAKHQDDIVRIAQDARALAKQIADLSKASRFDQANEAFNRMNARCNACHDLHPEKR